MTIKTNKLPIVTNLVGIEYPKVVTRTINPKLILEAYNKKLNKEKIIFLASYIADCELENPLTHPKLKFNANRTKAITWANISDNERIKDKKWNRIYIGKSISHDLNVHSIIHELAHTICEPKLKRELIGRIIRYNKRTGISRWCNKYKREHHHGRLFCVVQDYLLYEYREVWRGL